MCVCRQAHVARVKSREDVAAVRAQLLRNKKIARATHNIMAYRIRDARGSILQDNDEVRVFTAAERVWLPRGVLTPLDVAGPPPPPLAVNRTARLQRGRASPTFLTFCR